MIGWMKAELGAVASISAGNSAPQDPRLFFDGKFPFFRTSDIGRIRIGDIEAATDNLNEEGVLGLRRFPKGTILFPKSGASTFLNHRVMMAVDGYVSSHLATIVSNPAHVDSRFLLHYLTTIRAQDMVQDHAYPSLNLPLIAGIEVPLPPIHEQQRIVTILDEAFEGIATAKAKAERNLQNAREIFESWREEVFSQIGNDWIERSLSDICDIKHGYAFEGEFFTASGDYVLLTPGNFFEAGGYRDRGEKQKYFVGAIPDGYVLKKDDLLLVMTEQAAGLLGSPLLVPESSRFLHNQRLGLVLPRQDVAWSNEFFFHIFNLRRIRSEIHASASGVKVRHTSPSKIGAVRVAFPVELKVQKHIAYSLADISEECCRLAAKFECKLAALDELKKSLLHQAFTGQL